MIKLDLAFPPSTNHYWKKYRNRMVISKEGKDFATDVFWSAKMQLPKHRMFEDKLRIHVDLYPPDHRRRDLDNYAGKALYDALQRAGIFADDCLIRQSVNTWHEPVDEPHCVVRLERL